MTGSESGRSLLAGLGEFRDDAPLLGAVRAGAPLIVPLALLAAAAARRSLPLGAALAGLALWVAWFFRDPLRRCPARPDTVYAAADGTILAVEELAWDWFIHGRALRIATFLSPLDVHVNRSPVAGRLVASRREPGRHLPAFLARASAETSAAARAGASRGTAAGNTRQLLGIQRRPAHPHVEQTRSEWDEAAQRVVVVQIVGFLARRIVGWRAPGDDLAAGQKLGLIRFGSRTDVLLPAGAAEPLVAPGARVRAGLTPIARYHDARTWGG